MYFTNKSTQSHWKAAHCIGFILLESVLTLFALCLTSADIIVKAIVFTIKNALSIIFHLTIIIIFTGLYLLIYSIVAGIQHIGGNGLNSNLG